MLLMVSLALAERVYWTAPPTDADTAAVARTLPGATAAPLDTLGALGALTGDERAALATLRREYEACRPLLDVFDGELQIMARLSKATADVTVLASPEDRQLLFEALVIQGYAVNRYFQDRLGTEAAAAPYRVDLGGRPAIRAWLDATALLDAPSATMIPDAADRLAYDDVQAYLRAQPSVTFVLGALAKSAEVYLDGKRIEGGATTRVLAAPGRHFVHVRVGDTLLLRAAQRFEPGSTFTIDVPYGPMEQAALEALAATSDDGWTVPAGALALLDDEPTWLAIPGERQPRLLRVDGGTAVATRIVADRTKADGLYGRAAVGVGWASTGDWFLLNLEAGAPYERATVNALAPAISLGGGYRKGLFVAGVGVDAVLTTGEWHTLPSGDTALATWIYPHVAVGVPWVQVTAGPQLPWSFGLGAQGNLKLVGPLGVWAKGVYGIPLAIERSEGPTFEPLPTALAWGGVSVSFGG